MNPPMTATVRTESFPALAPPGSVWPVVRFTTGHTPPVPMVVVETKGGFPLWLYMDEVDLSTGSDME